MLSGICQKGVSLHWWHNICVTNFHDSWSSVLVYFETPKLLFFNEPKKKKKYIVTNPYYAKNYCCGYKISLMTESIYHSSNDQYTSKIIKGISCSQQQKKKLGRNLYTPYFFHQHILIYPIKKKAEKIMPENLTKGSIHSQWRYIYPYNMWLELVFMT